MDCNQGQASYGQPWAIAEKKDEDLLPYRGMGGWGKQAVVEKSPTQ